MRQRIRALLLSLLAVAVAGVSDLEAQSPGEKHSGTRAGATLTSFLGNDCCVSDSRPGFTTGMFGGMRPGRTPSLGLEVDRAKKGVKASDAEDSGVRPDGDRLVGLEVRHDLGLRDVIEGFDARKRAWLPRLPFGQVRNC